MIKPNEHETRILTGVEVRDFESGKKAAAVFKEKGSENVLITAGVNGAYLFTPEGEEYIPIPDINLPGSEKDETGCGDQTMATICAMLSEGKDITEAAKLGVLSGTLQFHKPGITPITKEEIEK